MSPEPASPQPNLVVETPLGPVWFWGRDTGRPVLLVIQDVFAPFGAFDLQSVLSDVDVLTTHVPGGGHAPVLVAHGVGPWAAALSSALKAQFGWRRCAVVGLGTGALAALAIEAPNVMRLLLVEPFLRTALIWPFRELPARARNDADRDILWSLLGTSETLVREQRDYRHLLDRLAVPGRVLVGAVPLGEQRDLPALPSFVQDADRVVLGLHPLLTVTVVEGAGHDVASQNMSVFFESVLEACAAL